MDRFLVDEFVFVHKGGCEFETKKTTSIWWVVNSDERTVLGFNGKEYKSFLIEDVKKV